MNPPQIVALYGAWCRRNAELYQAKGTRDGKLSISSPPNTLTAANDRWWDASPEELEFAPESAIYGEILLRRANGRWYRPSEGECPDLVWCKACQRYSHSYNQRCGLLDHVLREEWEKRARLMAWLEESSTEESGDLRVAIVAASLKDQELYAAFCRKAGVAYEFVPVQNEKGDWYSHEEVLRKVREVSPDLVMTRLGSDWLGVYLGKSLAQDGIAVVIADYGDREGHGSLRGVRRISPENQPQLLVDYLRKGGVSR